MKNTKEKPLLRRLGVPIAGAAIVALGVASAAHAATFTVSASNTSPTASSAGSVLFETPLVPMGCTSADATSMTAHTGTVTDPPGAIATIHNTSWTSCTGPLGLPMQVQHVGDWELHVTHPADVTAGNTDVIRGEITGVEAIVSEISNPANCTFTVKGKATGTWNEATSTLSVNETGFTGNLKVDKLHSTGCYGLIKPGHPANFVGDFVLDNGDWVYVSS